MNTINRDELKQKLDRGDNFKLVMTLNEWAFNEKHIPKSINVSSLDQAKQLSPSDEIIVYCSNPGCVASKVVYNVLTRKGFQNVRRYDGGIEDWEAAGYPMEGNISKKEKS